MSTEPLRGVELLDFVRRNEGLSRSMLAQKAGYMRVNRKGDTVPNPQALYDACLEAQGLRIVGSRKGSGLQPRVKSYETSVHGSGILMIGKTYVDELGYGPGSVFKIELAPNNDPNVIQLRFDRVNQPAAPEGGATGAVATAGGGAPEVVEVRPAAPAAAEQAPIGVG